MNVTSNEPTTPPTPKHAADRNAAYQNDDYPTMDDARRVADSYNSFEPCMPQNHRYWWGVKRNADTCRFEVICAVHSTPTGWPEGAHMVYLTVDHRKA